MSTTPQTVTYYQAIVPFYDLELADRGDIRFWIRLVRQHQPRSLLDLGAGTGRVTLPLARLLSACQGRVWGVDLSDEMLAVARAKAQRSQYSGWPDRLQFVQADLRDCDLQQPFDMIIAADDPFAHLLSDQDIDRALATVRRHLGPGGTFVLETPLHRGQLEADAQRQVVRREHTREVVRGDRRLVVAMVETFQPGASTGQASVRYALGRRHDPAMTTAEAHYTLRVHRPGDLEGHLARAGFCLTNRWSSFRFDPYDAARSDMRILEAQQGPLS